MMIKGYTITARVIGLAVAAILLLVSVGAFVRSCDKRRSEAAQTRVERGQAGAAANSAADAVGTVQRSGEAQAASEATTRSNEKDIRNAEGSTDKVNPAVRDAGFASLCKRPSFRNSPTGKLRCAPTQ